MRRDERLPRPPTPAGRVLDARLHLLSRQVLDADDVPLTTVDDLELRSTDDEPDQAPAVDGAITGARTYTVTALLTGAALAIRVLGGRAPASRWLRIDWGRVADIGTVVRITGTGDDLDATWTERWVRDQIIRRIPGGDHDPE